MSTTIHYIAWRVKLKNEAKSKIPTRTSTKTEKRFKILTPKQMLSRLLTALAQVQVGNNSQKLKKYNYIITSFFVSFKGNY